MSWAQFLLASRRSDASEPLATRRAAAVVRAALEAERPSEGNRFEERRSGSLFLIACSASHIGQPALDYAEKLGEAAAKLAAADPLPSPTRVLEDLRALPITIPSLREERLVRLAAKMANVAVSPRLELYPKNLDALRALKLAQATVAGLARISPDDLRSRVRDRYPEAQPLPDRPDLDSLVREAGLDLTWKDAEAAYCVPPAPVLESSTSLHREQTVVSPSLFVPPVELPREMEDALAFERRLQAAYRSPSYLVLATEPRLCHLQMAQTNLERHFPMAIFHCEREMLVALRREAETKKVRWEVILRADSTAPGARDWENLRKLAGNAAREVADQLRRRRESTLILYPGLLARYGQLTILDELQDRLGEHSLWLLIGSDRQTASPMADGHAIPARPSQWAWVPPKWLDNDFRKYRGGATS